MIVISTTQQLKRRIFDPRDLTLVRLAYVVQLCLKSVSLGAGVAELL